MAPSVFTKFDPAIKEPHYRFNKAYADIEWEILQDWYDTQEKYSFTFYVSEVTFS